MINISQVVSSVQTSINDLALERVQLAEYIDMLNDVAMDIAEETETWVGRYTITPFPSIWITGITYFTGQVVDFNGVLYYCLSTHVSGLFAVDFNANRWFVYSLVMGNSTGNVFFAKIPPSILLHYPYRLLRVVRGVTAGTAIISGIPTPTPETWQECYEYSQQTIAATTSNNASFMINNNQLGGSQFSTTLTDPAGQIDGGLTVIFGLPFVAGEQVVIDYISNRPWGDPGSDVGAFRQWLSNSTNPQTIPDYLRNSFYYGLLWKVCSSLFYKGDESFASRMQDSEAKYKVYLRKAVGYSKMFKDNRSSLQAQPLNWLAE